jgi:hypothetical protein
VPTHLDVIGICLNSMALPARSYIFSSRLGDYMLAGMIKHPRTPDMDQHTSNRRAQNELDHVKLSILSR